MRKVCNSGRQSGCKCFRCLARVELPNGIGSLLTVGFDFFDRRASDLPAQQGRAPTVLHPTSPEEPDHYEKYTDKQYGHQNLAILDLLGVFRGKWAPLTQKYYYEKEEQLLEFCHAASQLRQQHIYKCQESQGVLTPLL